MSQELYQEAKKYISGGSNLYSKRAELYPVNYPIYYKSARGIEITALDGRKYLDFSHFNVGANVLGYACEDVDTKVLQAIARGQTSTLLNEEEIELAKMLTTLHSWAQQVRYTRSGGEAVAVAVRIAKTYTGRQTVAWLPGHYHGWHINDPRTNEGQLTTKPAALIVEVARGGEPSPGWLEGLRDRATSEGTVLIFDEISTGFRSNLGGRHLHYGVTPDIAVFSKAMSNGYPMAAVIGTEEVMSSLQDTFVSSTAWSERIGPTAAIATIQKMWAEPVFEHTKYIGELVKGTIEWEAKRFDVKTSVIGPPQMLHFKFESPEQQTLFSQLMLDRGFLTSKDFYPSYAHTLEDCEKFAAAVREVFPLLNTATLNGPMAESGIRRC